MQDNSDKPPVVGLYLPAGHSVQTNAPELLLYELVPHGKHADEEVLPTVGLYVPGGHSEHSFTELEEEYDPLGQE